MAQNLVMRLMEEKQTEYEVSSMVWSPKMDILALSSTTGTVSLYRLQWQRIWAASPAEEGRLVTALAWRPDGKLLAAGDCSGLLTVRHIESSAALHTHQLDSRVVSLTWNDTGGGAEPDPDTEESSAQDWSFLDKLPSLSKTYSYGGGGVGQEELEDCRKLDSSDTSVLMAGTEAGTLYVLINGYLLCMKLSLSEILSTDSASIKSVDMTSDMRTLSVVAATGAEAGTLVTVRCPLLATCRQELLVLASKFCSIHGLLQYTEETIRQIREAWETILLEMDAKLSSYAENNPPGTLAADFLELLMFGVPTMQLKNFLDKEMPEKSLKKLGQSIDLSYSNIQRLVFRYLGAVCQSLNFQVWELLGLARLGHHYSVLGLTEAVVQTAVSRVQAFWAKGTELQQVIDESMKNFKSFFKWIYVEMLRQNEEPVLGDLSKVSQQDITFIADFLQRFQPLDAGSGGTGVTHVYLEKVGQYLREEDLVQPPDRSDNPWCALLEANPDLADTPFIIPVNSKTSLIKEHSQLEAAVGDIFSALARDLTSESVVVSRHSLGPAVDLGSVRQLSDEARVQGLVTHADNTKLLFWRTQCSPPGADTSLLWVHCEGRVVDTSFYTRDLVTLLLEEAEGRQTLVQVPVSALSSAAGPEASLTDLAGVRSRQLDSLSGCQLAVSGQRKVSACLFKNLKRLRIYDMEGEEEEEEETLESSGFSSSQLDVHM